MTFQREGGHASQEKRKAAAKMREEDQNPWKISRHKEKRRGKRACSIWTRLLLKREISCQSRGRRAEDCTPLPEISFFIDRGKNFSYL